MTDSNVFEYVSTPGEYNLSDVAIAAIIKENEDLKAFFAYLRPLLEIIEDNVGYKEGDDVDTSELVFKGVKWLRQCEEGNANVVEH